MMAEKVVFLHPSNHVTSNACTLAPSILIMVTSFTRILVVLHFVGLPWGSNYTTNQVLIGIAIFLTIFIMSPTFTEINENAIKPLESGQINEETALEVGVKSLRTFMLEQTNQKICNYL